MIDFKNINYLRLGNKIQTEVYTLLLKHKLFEKLVDYTPLLVGTIPININITNSDLDIVCYWKEKTEFKKVLTSNFSKFPDFILKETINRGHETIIARFTLDNYPIEIFGQKRPSHKQEAYRHMLIEYEIIQKKGEAFRNKIIALKEKGLKTEPAFAKALAIKGDPYDELLKYSFE